MPHAALFVAVALLSVMSVFACGEITFPEWAVVITPATATLVTAGETVQLSASARANEKTQTGKSFTWSSVVSYPVDSLSHTVASVNSSGLVTAVANGTAIIRAETRTSCLSFSHCPLVSGDATITVSIR